MNISNRVDMIKYIDNAISKAEKLGYRLDLDTILVDSRFKTVCPIGAIMLTKNNHSIPKDWMVVFMKAYEGKVHKDAAKHPVAHNLGLTYRRLFTKPVVQVNVA